MATKTITTTVTVHVKDEAKSVPFKYDNNGAVISGKHVIAEHPPGKPVTLEASEADRILARFGGEVVAPPAAEPKPKA